MKGKTKHQFTISGPGIDRQVASAALGLSGAITYASNASRAGRADTFYVRDANGKVVGRAETNGSGVLIYGMAGGREADELLRGGGQSLTSTTTVA